MKKSTVKTFNWIAFGMIPAIIVLIAVAFGIFAASAINSPTINYDYVTPQTESGELWKVLELVEGEYAYVIYSVDDVYRFDGERLIAFQGRSIEAIKDKVEESNSGGNGITSYWEGKGVKFDFSTTNDFEEYLEDVESSVYYNLEPDAEVITSNFSEVTLYDVSDYIGFERQNNSGVALGIMILVGAIVFWTVIVLAVELLIAIILKLTVFKVKKAQ
ncbi:MAG: hypothetical protein J6C06_05100 [Lachnospiraceae bacterium]|nr:hypothetical protein [Lachnospiraceae bacterium]